MKPVDRRRVLARVSRFVMTAGLVGGYGGFALIGARFLFPPAPPRTTRQYVTRARDLPVGGSMLYRAPNGEPINVTRLGEGASDGDFIALSSTCPHLGCRVHWEALNNRYFCPCHNGVFDPSGEAISGPPADAGQSLLRYPLEVEDGLVFVEVPAEPLRAPGLDE